MARWSRMVRRGAFWLIALVVVEYLVIPQVLALSRALPTLARINFFVVAGGIVLETLALVAYAQLTRAVLPAPSELPLGTVLRIDLATLAVSHIVPGGAAAGGGLGYRLLTEAGVAGPDAGFALATQGVGSAVVLNVLLWAGLVISIPLHGFNPLYVTAAILGAVLIGAFSAIVLALTRGEERASRFARTIGRKVPLLDEERMDRLVHHVADRLQRLAADPPLLRRAIGWAAANWLLDMASLGVFVLAFSHHRLSIDGLIVSYGIANVLAAIPVTPAGLGVVEAVLTPMLVGFGTPKGAAILAVIAWRIVNFWLPIPAGGVAYAHLHLDRDAPLKRKVVALGEAAAAARQESPTPKQWAAEHGLKLDR